MSEFPLDPDEIVEPIKTEVDSPQEEALPGDEVRRFIDRVSTVDGDAFSLFGEAGRGFRSALNIPRFSDRFRSGGAFSPDTTGRVFEGQRTFASEQISYRMGEDLQAKAGVLKSGIGLSALPAIEDRSFAAIQTPSRALTNQLTVFERKSDSGQVQQLISSVYDLQRKLGTTAISRITPRYAYKVINGRTVEVPVGVQVAVRNFNETFLKSSLFDRSQLVLGTEHTFNLTADERGAVIDTKSNRYINGAAFALGEGVKTQRVASGIETAVGLIATYARSSHFEARTGLIDTVFNTMVARGEFTSFGFVFGQIQQRLIQAGATRRSQYSGQELDRVLKSISVEPDTVDPRLNLSSPETSQLRVSVYQKRLEALRSAFSPALRLGASVETLQTSYQNLARMMQKSKTIIKLSGQEELEVDLFSDLKRAAVEMSPQGKNYYNFLKGNLSGNILDTLYAPFMQPHEASYSAGQLHARMGLYQTPNVSGPGNFYDSVYAKGVYYLNPSPYRHGDLKTQAGYFTKPIGSTVGSQMDSTGEKQVATFFSNEQLFSSSPQLNTTSIRRVLEVLKDVGYRGQDEIRAALHQELGFEKEDQNETIFLMPFKKPEQMSQRLKNFLGTRSAREISLDLQQALDSGDVQRVQSYLKRDAFGYLELDYNRTLAGNINTALPTQQFQYAQNLRQELLETIAKREGVQPQQVLASSKLQQQLSEELTKTLRERDSLPTAMRGLIGGRNDRRVLVGFGATELSDFYYANEDYQASYSDLHFSRLRVNQLQRTEGAGGVVYENSLQANEELALIKRVFQPGSVLYYEPQKVDRATGTMRVLQQVFDSLDLSAGLKVSALKNQFRFIDSVSFDTEGRLKDLVVKPGLYQFDAESDLLLQVGELHQSELRLGLQRSSDRQGNSILSEYSVKVPGKTRGFQGGKAVVAGAVSNQAEVPFLITFPNVAGMRSGVDFTKGPAVFIKGDLFREYDAQYQNQIYSRDTQSDRLFGLMSPSAFKGYTYESGLSILRDQQSRARLFSLTSGEVGTYLSLVLAGSDEQLKSALKTYLSSEYSTFSSDEKAKLTSLLSSSSSIGAGAEKLKNLVLQAPAIAGLAGRSAKSNEGLSAPLVQIRQRLTRAFESASQGKNQALQTFSADVYGLIEKSFEPSRSFEQTQRVNGEVATFQVFEENDPYVRSAAILSDVLSTLQQGVRYRGLASGKSLLSLNLTDERGRVSVEKFLDRGKNARDAILNLGYSSGLSFPSDSKISELVSLRQSGQATSNETYQELSEGLTNLYFQTQSSILVQRAIKFLPSRIMVPTGSEDQVGLEYHYSLSLSNRALQELRGRGLETEDLAHSQMAYSVVASYGNPYTFQRLKLLSPFQERSVLHRQTSQLIQSFNPLATSLPSFGRNQNQTLLELLTESQLQGNLAQTELYLQQMREVQRVAQSFDEGAVGVGRASERVARYFDSRRGLDFRSLKQKQVNPPPQRFVFFDIETYDFVNSDFSEGDARRYPKQLAELAYVIQTADGTEVQRRSLLVQKPDNLTEVPEKFRSLDFTDAVSPNQALSSFFSNLQEGDALVGHNVARFDIPTMSGLAKGMGINAQRFLGLQVIDTLLDIDKQQTKAALQVEGGFSLGSLYRAALKKDLVEQLNQQPKDSFTYQALIERIADETTYQYDAHRALSDVDANTQVFRALQKKGLFRQTKGSESPKSPFHQSVPYFGYSGDVEHRFRFDVADYVLDLSQKSKGYSLVYEFERQRASLRNDAEFRSRFSDGLDADLVLDHIRFAIDQSTERSGSLKFKGDNARDLIVQTLVDSDRRFEEKVQESLRPSEDRYISAMQEQSKILQRFLKSRAGSDAENKQARELLKGLTETRSYVLPDIAAEQNPATGERRLRVYGEGLSSAPILGLDVLSSVPRRFKDHVSEVVTTQRELRELENEYSQIARKIKGGEIVNPTERELYVVDRFSQLGIQANEQMATLGGSVLKQRAYGERVKYPGVSFIAAASALLGAEEAAFGSRIGAGFLEADTQTRATLEHTRQEVVNLENRREFLVDQDNSVDLLRRVESRLDQKRREVQTLESFGGEKPGLYARANRAGGPFQASIVEQELYAQPIQETVIARSKQENSLLQIAEKGNETALFLSMFGRFGTQGGDFDGDAYQLIFGFKQGQKDYLKALDQKRDLEQARRVIERDLETSTDFSYQNYRRQELGSVDQELGQLGKSLLTLENSLPYQRKSLETLSSRAKDGIRRHTAAYFGAPTELFSTEAGVFNDREVLTMIEQQRGILGQLENYSENPNLNNDALLKGFSQLNRSGALDSALQSGNLRSVIQTQLGSHIDVEQQNRLADLVERNINRFAGLSDLSAVERESLRLNRFAELAAEQSSLLSFVNEYSGMLSAAAGIAMGARTFETMQTVIGSQGTSLIGEAYNAITALGPQAMTARAFAEVLGSDLVGVRSSGLEKSPSFNFAERLSQTVENLFQGDLGGVETEAKSLLLSSLSESGVESFSQSALERTEDITGKLAVIQQVIRDSLKLKEAGGLLTAIKKRAGGESFERRFLSEENNGVRFSMLRDFISRESGAGLNSLDRKNAFMDKDSAPINQFGALLLLSDYLRADASDGGAAFDRMVDGKGRYEILRQRRDFFRGQVDQVADGKQRQFTERMATDSEFLVRQTVLDLMNAVVAEKQVDTMLQDRNAVEQTRRIRERYIMAAAGEEGANHAALRAGLGRLESNPILQAYDIQDQDIQQFQEQRAAGLSSESVQFRDVFSPEEIERAGGQFSENSLLSRARRIHYEANLAYRSGRGITERDLLSMRKTLQASREFRFNTEEVALDFKEFISAEAENLEAFRVYSRREHLDSPDEYRLLQTQMASKYSGAIANVTDRLTQRYGSLGSALSQQDIGDAYTQMVGISGLFNQSDRDEGVIKSAEEMMALAMSQSKNGRSLFNDFADRFAGMRVLEESQQMYRSFLSEGGDSDSEEGRYRSELMEEYAEAVKMDQRSGTEFVVKLGQQTRQNEEAAKRIEQLDIRVEQQQQENKSQRFASAVSLIAGPLAIAALDSGLSLNDNLLARGLDLVQGFAATEDLRGTQSGASSATMFQVARLRDQMSSEGSALLGGARGLLSEAMYGSLSQISYELFGANRNRGAKGGLLSGLAEVGATALSLAASRVMSNQKVGAREEPYRDYLQETVAGLAEQVGLYMQAALEAQRDVEIEMEDSDGEIYYEFDREVQPNEYQEKINTGWIEVEMDSEEGVALDMVEA